VWVLLFGMIITGVLMAYPQWGDLWPEPLFRLKLSLVGLLFLNSFAITAIMPAAFETPFASLSRSHQTHMLISGAVSGLSWVGAIAIGLYLFA
jgi:hypothetical protein